jgi:5-enolpyruvylshikimate-3-phosphate synthase
MKIEPAKAIRGHIAVPGDKSISHRAVLVGAIADGETRVEGFGRSADTESTIAAARALGVAVHDDDVDVLRVEGAGLRADSAKRRSRSTAETPARRCDCSPGSSLGRRGRLS